MCTVRLTDCEVVRRVLTKYDVRPLSKPYWTKADREEMLTLLKRDPSLENVSRDLEQEPAYVRVGVRSRVIEALRAEHQDDDGYPMDMSQSPKSVEGPSSPIGLAAPPQSESVKLASPVGTETTAPPQSPAASAVAPAAQPQATVGISASTISTALGNPPSAEDCLGRFLESEAEKPPRRAELIETYRLVYPLPETTDELVRALLASGVPHEDISSAYGAARPQLAAFLKEQHQPPVNQALIDMYRRTRPLPATNHALIEALEGRVISRADIGVALGYTSDPGQFIASFLKDHGAQPPRNPARIALLPMKLLPETNRRLIHALVEARVSHDEISAALGFNAADHVKKFLSHHGSAPPHDTLLKELRAARPQVTIADAESVLLHSGLSNEQMVRLLLLDGCSPAAACVRLGINNTQAAQSSARQRLESWLASGAEDRDARLRLLKWFTFDEQSTEVLRVWHVGKESTIIIADLQREVDTSNTIPRDDWLSEMVLYPREVGHDWPSEMGRYPKEDPPVIDQARHPVSRISIDGL